MNVTDKVCSPSHTSSLHLHAFIIYTIDEERRKLLLNDLSLFVVTQTDERWIVFIVS